MKKTTLILLVTVFTVFFTTTLVSANAYSLQADNGKVMPPTGIGFDLTGNLAQVDGAKTNWVKGIDAAISYGIRPSITVTGELSGLADSSGNIQELIKVLYSPVQSWNGYTLYASYDLGQGKIPEYGVSLWSDLKFIYAYLNFEAGLDIAKTSVPFVITPGANLQISSKLRLGSELEINPENWKYQELRVGVDYLITKNFCAKVMLDDTMKNQKSIQAGISFQI